MTGYSIFLIDDDADDREIITAALGEIDPKTECVTANNGREALNRIMNTSMKTDLVILDLNMPLMNGKEFLREIKERNLLSKVPVVVFSTTLDPATIEEIKALGVAGYHTKPENYEKLLGTLKYVLQEGNYIR